MEEYDVLGNFKDLQNIFKNIPTAPVPLEAPICPDLGDNFEDSFLSKLAPSPEKKKKTSAKSSQVKPPSNKKQEAPKLEEPASSSQNAVAYRTRSSLGREDSSQNNSTAEILPSNEGNGPKSKRGRGRKSITNASLIASDPSVAMPQTKPKNSTRGRKKKSSAPSATVIDAIEIDDAENHLTAPRAIAEPRDSTRARRNIIAERAARCPTVGVVDLISSPLVRVEGYINLDEDDEDDTKTLVSKTTVTNQSSLNMSFDEDNPEMKIKINWKGKPEMFKLRKYQKFQDIFEQLAKRENKTLDHIFLNLNSQIIKPDDTPDTINYKIFHIIDGRAMDNSEISTGAIPKKKRDPNIIKLKVQSDKFKKPFVIELNKTDNFRKLLIKCAEELKVPYENIIKLCFDGETLEQHQTPVDVELEGGEMIEIHLKK